MRIPDDAVQITDKRLTQIRAISQLHDRLLECEGGLKDQVKAAMAAKGATHAHSDLVVARLQQSGRTIVCPRKLHALIKAGKITLDQFLCLVSINGRKLAGILSGAEIEELGTYQTHSPSLVTEWRQGVVFDPERVAAAIAAAVATKPKRRAG